MQAQPDNRIAKAQEDESCNAIIYTELNLEKWSIWEPTSSKKTPRARIIERQRALPDGSTVAARVEIGITHHGNLSTRDQKIYYILIKLWDDAGRPETPVAFSLQKIARELGEEWSSHAHRTITQSLLQLRGVLFSWENSFFDKASGDHMELLDTFNILSELTLARRTRKLRATTEMCLFQFHREILKNLHANHTTPLFLATVLSFKSEIAQMLYPRLDLLLSDKKHYERRTKALFEELGLEAETYRHKSARKRVIEKALEELRGVPLTTGCIVSATVEPTKDDADFKIVICKGARAKRLPALRKDAPTKPPAQLPLFEAGHTSVSPAASLREKETPEALLVRYFHQQFHGTAPKGTLNPRELVSAARLIEQHGLGGAKGLVDFAHQEAPKTNYTPASLNGILQYEGRFEADRAAMERAGQKRRDRQERERRSQEAQQAQQSALVNGLRERAGRVETSAPQAFAAFVRHIEEERETFLNTPIARRAKPETRALLSREYERPARRLELFIDFFGVGSEGEALLSMYASCKDIARWLQDHGEAVREILAHSDLPNETS